MKENNHNVFIYIASIDNLLTDRLLFNKVYNLSSNERKSKTCDLAIYSDKCLSLGVEYLLINACNDLNIDYPNLKIEKTNLGKPYFSNCNYKFNLSHSSSYVMCIISQLEVGCDIEKIKNIDLNISRKYFSIEENQFINDSSDIDKVNNFFRLWTLKESYIKCTGLGLSKIKDSYLLINNDIINIKNKNDQFNYQFGEILVNSDYKCSYCIRLNKDDKINVKVNMINID